LEPFFTSSEGEDGGAGRLRDFPAVGVSSFAAEEIILINMTLSLVEK
jgi:hypothetical protein